MLICNRCSTQNLDIAKYCKNCGSSSLYDPDAERKRKEAERKRKEE